MCGEQLSGSVSSEKAANSKRANASVRVFYTLYCSYLIKSDVPNLLCVLRVKSAFSNIVKIHSSFQSEAPPELKQVCEQMFLPLQVKHLM